MLGHVEFAKEILKIRPYFASVVDSQGFTPLHLASTRNDVDMVKVLLEANMDACTVQDQEGRTPLHLAALKGQVKIMKLLIQEKPQAIHYRMARNNVTIIHYCVQNNSFKALKYLVEYLVGVDVEDMNQDSVSLNSTDDDGNTILHLAAQGKNMKVILTLID
ncbi:hypothetical protein MKW98_010008 [Papaver atlanticum]|uniref:Uncharacterized protein n=1 Tax=Papaver atlanticum TaxID=357466 RepID=A0AAD4RXP4_9MAGN|nr:hypothetical protein MKW98_010008 [Papaver atlanticum]